MICTVLSLIFVWSPSSRRAWIEIFGPSVSSGAFPSPSSRRAWIEMLLLHVLLWFWLVALLAEGVDRNQFSPVVLRYGCCRPPRGGRG